MARAALELVVRLNDMATAPLKGLQGTLQRVGEVAAGVLGAQLVQAGGRALVQLSQDAFAATASYEKLRMTLESLAAIEAMNAGQAQTMGQALGESAERAQELLRWVTALAIKSPFTEETVANTLQTLMGYDMTSKMAQELTQSLINFGAATGRSEEQTKLLGLALGQVWAKGKLTGEEMRQLTNAGLGVGVMARALGLDAKTLSERIAEGAVSAAELIPAFIALSDKQFGDAASRMAESWGGLTSTLKDIKSIGLRELFAGSFGAIQPYVAEFVKTLSDPATMAQIRRFGDEVGTALSGVLKTVVELKTASVGGVGGILAYLVMGGKLDTKTAGAIADITMQLEALAKQTRDEVPVGVAEMRKAWEDFLPTAELVRVKLADLWEVNTSGIPGLRDIVAEMNRLADIAGLKLPGYLSDTRVAWVAWTDITETNKGIIIKAWEEIDRIMGTVRNNWNQAVFKHPFANFDISKDPIIQWSNEVGGALRVLIDLWERLSKLRLPEMPSMPTLGGGSAPVLPLPGYASGGWSGGGLAWVGEQGPELVGLPRGSRVYSARESRQMAGGPQTVNIVNRAGDTVMIRDRASAALYVETLRTKRLARLAEGF